MAGFYLQGMRHEMKKPFKSFTKLRESKARYPTTDEVAIGQSDARTLETRILQ